MPAQIVTVPCRTDNYAFLVHDAASGRTALVDAPEAAPIQAELDRRGWKLDEVWLTHHHRDHVEGVEGLRARYGCTVRGAKADAHRLPPLDAMIEDGDGFAFGDDRVDVMGVPGHTLGHIAFHMPASGAVFTADTLMALGCGRVFEGTFPQMWASLSRLAALPPETVVYSGHEYTAANGRFAMTIEPGNPALLARIAAVAEARAAGKPTVPSILSDELATNPFLRARLPEVKAAIGLPGASDAEAFAEIRRRKDAF